MNIKLRTAGLDDLNIIYAIRRDAILGVPSEASLSDRQTWADKRSPNYYEDRLTAGRVVIASFGNDNLGWGSSSDEWITGLYVCSSWCRRGIGRTIMSGLEMEIVRRGYTCARLGSSPDAVGFYTKLGYELVELPDNDGAVPMKKHLSMTDSKFVAV